MQKLQRGAENGAAIHQPEQNTFCLLLSAPEQDQTWLFSEKKNYESHVTSFIKHTMVRTVVYLRCSKRYKLSQANDPSDAAKTHQKSDAVNICHQWMLDGRSECWTFCCVPLHRTWTSIEPLRRPCRPSLLTSDLWAAPSVFRDGTRTFFFFSPFISF